MLYQKKVLDNGLRIIAVPMKDNPTVTVMVSVEAGSEYETKEINGLSHFLEHMLFKGTSRRPSSKIISTEFDSIGAEHNAFTDNENTSYYGKAQAKHLPKILDLIADMYLDPLLPANELEKEKGVVIEEINMNEDIPQHKVEDVLDELLYGNQPAGFTILGPKENIRSMNRDKLIEYRKHHYVGSGTVLMVAGNFVQEELFKAAEKSFASIPNLPKSAKVKTTITQEEPAVKLFSKNTDQAHLRLAFRSYDLYDERFWALSLLATILGAGMSSRLFHKMREELGLCYYIHAQNRAAIDHGQFVVSIGTGKEKNGEAIKAIIGELKKITTEAIDQDELEKAKEFRIGHLYLGLESSDDFAQFYGFQELYHKKIITPEEWADNIRKVAVKDIQKVAGEIFQNKKMNLAVVGPFKNEEEFLPLLKIS
jgi:predicted Zn-dependent peptidase